MMTKYILDEEGNPVAVDDVLVWAEWMEGPAERWRMALTQVGECRVSTVFLGLDHRWGEGPPILFETMVFGGLLDGEVERYATLAEAMAGHESLASKVRALECVTPQGIEEALGIAKELPGGGFVSLYRLLFGGRERGAGNHRVLRLHGRRRRRGRI